MLYLVWRKNRKHEQRGGEWGKVLKRFYRLAGIAGARFLRVRTQADALREPTLIDRIADYVRVTGTAAEYLAFLHNLWGHPEQVYPDVNQILAEGLLRLEPEPKKPRPLGSWHPICCLERPRSLETCAVRRSHRS